VNRALAEAIVGCLTLTSSVDDLNRIEKFTSRDWKHTLSWLDNSGLTLYFLQRLKSVNATTLLPPPVLAQFEKNLADNLCRVDAMAVEFGSLNEAFNRAGVNYAVVKGFSLVPSFCPDAALRTQSDIDYLIDEQSLLPAQRILHEQGYDLTKHHSTEFVFAKPQKRIPTRFDSPYSTDTSAWIELHLAFWDSREQSLQVLGPQFALTRAAPHQWHGLTFPALDDTDAFLLQTQHVMSHVLTYWVKMSWLFEIANFLDQRRSDTVFWSLIERRVREVSGFEDFMAFAIGLTAKVFDAPIPPVAANWIACLRPAAKLWLDRYARSWAFEDNPLHVSSPFPRAKLVLFLHQAYIQDPVTRGQVLRQRLFPWKKRSRINVTTNQTLSSQSPPKWQTWDVILNVLIFHVGSGLRYFWELPRWRKLNRLASQHLMKSGSSNEVVAL
jgi:Uncharacterised nucleotidyltransferase